MNYPKLFFVFSVFFLLFGGLYAQDKTVTGVVTDESKTPLIGVSVVVKGTTRGVSTDFDGKFTLKPKKVKLLSLVQWDMSLKTKR